jgi:hypothetical protein
MTIKHPKKLTIVLWILTAGVALFVAAMSFQSWFGSAALPLPPAAKYNFYIITDFGTAKGTHGSKAAVAAEMNEMASSVAPRFIISSGDNFHDAAPVTATDSVWKWNFEQFFNTGYNGTLKWYTLLGNHDYNGKPDAQIAYGDLHPRWIMPSRYYTFVQKTDDSTSIRFIMLDTSPFVDSYRKRFDSQGALVAYTEKELRWADSVLTVSHERWKVVVGHHPIYNAGVFAGLGHNLVNQLDPILRKHKVDFYFAGHVHTFQHNQKNGIDYVVTASAWKSRIVTPWYFTRYYKNATGFTLCSVDNHHFTFYFIDPKGKVLYSYNRAK